MKIDAGGCCGSSVVVHRMTAKRPNHVWHIDLTVIPAQSGFWCPWLPFAFPQCWPFCWWEAMRQERLSLVEWYNQFRPHMTLKGATPNEVYFGRFPANRRPRLEPRPHWPRGSPCAVPQVLVAGQPGDKFVLERRHHDGRAH